MKTKTAFALNLLFVIVAAGYSLYLSSKMPQFVPIHWDIQGRADRYGDKSITLWAMPATMALMAVLLLWLPKVSPAQFSIDPFKPVFNSLMTLINGMLGYLHYVIIQATLRPDFDILKHMGVGMFVTFALLGNSIGKVRRNHWMGVRTPWTLSSDANWIATHRFAAWSMTVVNLVALVALLAGANWAFCFTVSMLSMISPIAYSFYHYKTKPQ